MDGHISDKSLKRVRRCTSYQ